MADAGFGIETGARQFGLDFHPVATENYYIAINKNSLDKPAIQEMLSIMQDPTFRDQINNIAGYECKHPSVIISIKEEFNL